MSKKIISSILISMLLLTTFSNTIFAENAVETIPQIIVSDFVTNSLDDKTITEMLLNIDNELIKYTVTDYKDGSRTVAYTENGKQNTLYLDTNSKKLYLNNKLISTTQTTNNSLMFNNMFSMVQAASTIVYNIDDLTWKLISTTNFEINVAAAVGTVAGITAIVVAFVPASEVAVIKALATVGGIATITNANTDEIYVKFRQYRSNELIQLFSTPDYMYKHAVRFYESDYFSSAIGGWGECEPYFGSRPY